MAKFGSVVLAALILVLFPLSLPAKAEVQARLAGSAFIGGFGFNLTINTERSDVGLVSGTVTASDVCPGKAVELVSPFGVRNFWCVNVIMTTSDCSLAGDNVVLFVRDVTGGPDEVSFVGGLTVSCADFDVSPDRWEPVTSGDFVGTVMNPCADSEAALAQCESDLSTYRERCDLPPLPAGYEAKFSGSGFSPSLNSKVKISAIRRDIGEVIGRSRVGDGSVSPVMELQPPHLDRNYWCIKDTDGLWFVKDVGQGCDPLIYAIPGPDLNCDNTVPTLPFEPSPKGNFKGKVRCGENQCCPLS